MCRRPSCCNNPRSQGGGIPTVALIMLALLIVARVGPIVARIARTVIEVISLAAMAAGLVLVLAAVTWAAIVITRWQRRRRAFAAARTRVVIMPAIRLPVDQVSGPPGCLACGGTGTVLRAISSTRYQLGECPVCDPVKRAG